MTLPPSKDALTRPALPLHLVESLAQVSVDYVLAPYGIKRKVFAMGSGFANCDKFPLLILVMTTLEWYWENPNQDLTESTFRDIAEKVKVMTFEELFPKGVSKKPHIRVPEVWKKVPVFYDTVIQGGSFHEAWHTTKSERGVLDVDRAVREFWPKLPPRAKMTSVRLDFLKSLWNVLEDTMIEHVGVSEQPETRPTMCTIMDHIQRLEQQARSFNNISASGVFLGLLRDLGRGYNLSSVHATIREYTMAYPKLVDMFREDGFFYPYLERAQALTNSYDVVSLFLDLWKVADGFADAAKPREKPKAKEGGSESEEKGEGKKKGKEKGKGKGKGKEDPKEEAGPGVGEPSSSGGLGEKRDADGSEGPFDEDMGMEELCEEILDCPQQWFHLTVGSMIEQIIKNLQLQKPDYNLLPGEAPWNPASVKDDKITIAALGDFASSRRRLQEVRPIVAAIRTRLRILFVAQRVPERQEGLKKGRKISRKYMVETMGMLRSEEVPQRAFRADLPVRKQDMAIVLCTDESGSMLSVRQPLIQAFLALAEGMSSVGQNVFAFGIKSGKYSSDGTHRSGTFHRTHSVEYLIYQKWGEPFQTVSQRFDSVSPDGGTPLGDGLHFALELLRKRPETHRIVLMLTDGDPDSGHAPVIRYEQRIALGERIHVVGVGIGSYSGNLAALFPDHVVIPNAEDLPNRLMGKLYELCHARIKESST